jgi:hypothetical protein
MTMLCPPLNKPYGRCNCDDEAMVEFPKTGPCCADGERVVPPALPMVSAAVGAVLVPAHRDQTAFVGVVGAAAGLGGRPSWLRTGSLPFFTEVDDERDRAPPKRSPPKAGIARGVPGGEGVTRPVSKKNLSAILVGGQGMYGLPVLNWLLSGLPMKLSVRNTCRRRLAYARQRRVASVVVVQLRCEVDAEVAVEEEEEEEGEAA